MIAFLKETIYHTEQTIFRKSKISEKRIVKDRFHFRLQLLLLFLRKTGVKHNFVKP